MTPQQLTARRKSMGMNKEELSRALLARGMPGSRHTIQRWERGDCPVPAWLCLALDSIEAEGGELAD